LPEQYVMARQSEADQLVLPTNRSPAAGEDHRFIPPIPRPLPAVLAAFRRALERDTAP